MQQILELTSAASEVAPAASAADPVAEAPLTPMLRQYLETKAQNPRAILFFRLGDFYEMFFEDAVRAAEILQIALTSRAKGADRVPMCGVPHHSARRYIARLIEAGLSVALCEQVEEPDGRALVRREVTRVITPGTVLDEDLLVPGEGSYLAAASLTGAGELGLAWLDASTGEFCAASLDGLDALVDAVARIGPRELLVSEDAPDSSTSRLLEKLARRPVVTRVERRSFDVRRASALLMAHFRVAALDGFGVADAPVAVSAAGAALGYLRDTQRAAASHVARLVRVRRQGSMWLDGASLANLEIVRTLQDGSRRGSLLWALDKTRTGMGARKLARWLAAPLTEVTAIDARLDAVDELVDRGALREALASGLDGVADIERLCGRLAMGLGTPRELKALGVSLTRVHALASSLEAARAPLLRGLAAVLGTADVRSIGELISDALVEEPPVAVKDGGLFRLGYHSELDELTALARDGREVLAKLEARERERTGIGSLKVRYNKVFGYYIEVTRPNLHLVPAEYVRRQTTVNAERFVTPELKDYEERVLSADDRRATLEQELFDALRARVMEGVETVRACADAVATLDVLSSHARAALDHGYVRPRVDDSRVIELRAARHPVVERLLEREPFVPNDVTLDGDEAQVLVITGPNMAGKSTVMRQVALNVLLAQAGSFVAAADARIGVCDRIFTRVGASDNLARGHSTFMVEMTETANILNHATARSLVLLDEIGRGTSTFDGLSIAWAVAEHLHDRSGARTLFATHYHELTELPLLKARVKNCSIAVKEHAGKVVFLRKLVDGGASRSYGIEVARLAGLPAEVLERAREILRTLEATELDAAGRPRVVSPPVDGACASARADVREEEKEKPSLAQELVESLASLDLDRLRPLDALGWLADWKTRLETALDHPKDRATICRPVRVVPT